MQKQQNYHDTGSNGNNCAYMQVHQQICHAYTCMCVSLTSYTILVHCLGIRLSGVTIYLVWLSLLLFREGDRERESERERKKEREKERKKDRKKERQKERKKDRKKERKKQRKERERERHDMT